MKSLLAMAVLATSALPADAINVVIDYAYAGSFFDASTTNGALARANVEFAADYFSSIIDDTLTPISNPETFVSEFGGTASWGWNTSFPNPSGSGTVNVANVTIPQDEYRIYVGAEPLAGSTLGIGGYATAGWGRSIGGTGSFQQSDIPLIDAITDDFSENLDQRGKPSGEWANWGGYLSLDSSENWHYDHTVAPPSGSGQNDLFSTVLHEIGHSLGIGTVPEWDNKVTGSTFFGLNSFAANGNVYPTLSPDGGHWLAGTTSTLFGGTASQEAAMDPNITTGTRKLWTELDAAALEDIGWTVVAPVVIELPGDANGDGTVDLLDLDILGSEFGMSMGGLSPADFNGDGNVDLLDLDILGANFGQSIAAVAIPEPAALALFGIALAAGRLRR